MAYKKYIKKNGKIYGPYIYHSKRVDGKVVTEYKGAESSKFDSKKVLPILGIFVAVLILGFAMYLFINSNSGGLTGFSVLDLEANYQPGENLEGKLDLMLQEGELVPATSSVVFEMQNERYQYPLREILSEDLVEGNFYVDGSNISGEGIGYGLPGKKLVYPNVSFVLLVYAPGENDTFIETEVKGNVSANMTYEYTLRENESAELKHLSANSNGESLSDDVLSLEILNNTASVSTNYSSFEEGFGKEYVGKNIKEISINLSALNLNLSEGNLSIRLEYLGNNLTELNTKLKVGSVQDSEPSSVGGTEVVSENDTLEINFSLGETPLTLQEQRVLENEFENLSLNAVEAFSNNGFITIRYQLRDYWVEHSYSEDLDNATLSRLMEEDRTKWLKDIASNLLSEESNQILLDNFTGTYDF